MEILYLDYNCFQRGFDDSRQRRIRNEAAACQEIFQKAESGKIELAWSFMHEDETELCPFPERKYEVGRLSDLCRLKVAAVQEVYQTAKRLRFHYGISSKDAVHVACALFIGADYFITCDDSLMKRLKIAELETPLLNPLDYIHL